MNFQGLFVTAGMLLIYVLSWYSALKHGRVSEVSFVLLLGQVFTFLFTGFNHLHQFAGTFLVLTGLGLHYLLENKSSQGYKRVIAAN